MKGSRSELESEKIDRFHSITKAEEQPPNYGQGPVNMFTDHLNAIQRLQQTDRP